MRSLPLAVLVFVSSGLAQGQPHNGPRPVEPRWTAFVDARVVTEPGTTIEHATLVCRNGLVVSVTANGKPPEGARIVDCKGLSIYPAFIEPYLPVDVPKLDPKTPGAHWHARVRAQQSALDGNGVADKDIDAMLGLGFGAAAIAPKEGIFRGAGSVVLLQDKTQRKVSGKGIVRRHAYHAVAFERGGRGGGHPASQMGAIAVIRQGLHDTTWHALRRRVAAKNPKKFEPVPPSHALEALDDRDIPLLFVVDEEQEQLRAHAIAQEFGRECILLGGGTEFRNLGAFTKTKPRLILPLAFPKAPDVKTIAAAESVSLQAMMTWEHAPTNPARVVGAGIAAALTSHRLEKKEDFHVNLRRAILQGLSKKDALAMLTTRPADMLGVKDRLGRLSPGMIANLMVVKGDLFDKQGKLLDVWVAGERHIVELRPEVQLTGTWQLKIDGTTSVRVEITRKTKDFKVAVLPDVEGKKKVAAKEVRQHENRLSFLVDGKALGKKGVHRFAGLVEDGRILGRGSNDSGGVFTWTGERTGAVTTKSEDKDKDKDDPVLDLRKPLPLPFGAFGRTKYPDQQTIVATGATLWTCGKNGKIENGTLVVQDGKLLYAGKATGAPTIDGALTLDLSGKHVTPGLIDCHSHTGIRRGINEGQQTVTAEVRIQDVLNATDVNFYRQLAGGLTVANQLHGSANPIGGQNNVVKLRWGVIDPDAMRLEGAPSGIKFALGENVKQSNWDITERTRYPQTRMGVETLIRDRFLAARDFEKELARYMKQLHEGRDAVERYMPPRLDLELQTLAEILQGKRLIHCHSYRQDEILMLCRVARDFGFKIGTFQHVLEGYKVAEAIKDHALGGSAFSDWWAYKIEVFDAIPDNGAIMHEVGIAVSFNSDSNEVARHMNTEAAKAVKYGGVAPEEALKFVTLNPAIQLGIQDKVGSLEKGKDADFVVWSGSPLSHYSRCLATYIDGRRMFSVEEDRELRAAAVKERRRLVQKLLNMPERSKDLAKGDKKTERLDWRSARYRWHLLQQLRRKQQTRQDCNCFDSEEDER